MKEELRCKVARILSTTELVLNKGRSQGLREGMIFDVQGELDIRDPDSGETLETIPYTKVSVRVSKLGERVAIAATYRQIQTNYTMSLLRGSRTTQPELIESKEITKPSEWDKAVSIGDIAIRVSDVE